MTIRIPVRALLFFLYTAAVLAGAFGISYVVFEWRDDDGAFDPSAIERRIDDLERQGDFRPTQAELDAQRCEAALEAMGAATTGGGFIAPPLYTAVDRYCK